MFRLNRNKQKTKRNSLIGSIFCYFLQTILGFSGFFPYIQFFCFFFVFFVFFVFFSLFRNSLFRLFRFYTETESSNWTKTNRRPTQTVYKSLKTKIPVKTLGHCAVNKYIFSLQECIFGKFFGLLRNRSVCFGCFDIGSKHQNKPKFFLFGFTKQTETNAKQIGLNQKLIWFFSRTP